MRVRTGLFIIVKLERDVAMGLSQILSMNYGYDSARKRGFSSSHRQGTVTCLGRKLGANKLSGGGDNLVLCYRKLGGSWGKLGEVGGIWGSLLDSISVRSTFRWCFHNSFAGVDIGNEIAQHA